MNIEDLLKSAEVQSKIPSSIIEASRRGRLNNLLVIKMANEGISLPEGFTVEAALKELGKKLYIKNAEWGLVRQGLDALKGL